MRLGGLEVIVAGAGTGGAAAALLLARAGAHVTVVEKVAQPRAVGAGIALAGNGLAVLESIGLGDAIVAASCAAESPRVVDARGRTLFAPPGATPTLRMLRRSALQTLLLDALAAQPGAECLFGAEIVAAAPRGTVVVREAGTEYELSADLVVGADGVHSAVRAQAGFAVRAGGSGLRYVRALVNHAPATGVEAWTAAGLFGSFPVPDGTYLYASAGSRACRTAIAARDLRGFADAWASAYPDAAPLVRAISGWDDLLVNEVLTVECPDWVRGRVVLLGDAAHAMAPNLGQGANSALVDAAVLLDELRRHPDLETALAAYQARRQPAVRKVASAAGRLGRLAEITNPAARMCRDRLLMPLAQRLTRPSDLALVLQEPIDTLRTIGRS